MRLLPKISLHSIPQQPPGRPLDYLHIAHHEPDQTQTVREISDTDEIVLRHAVQYEGTKGSLTYENTSTHMKGGARLQPVAIRMQDAHDGGVHGHAESGYQRPPLPALKGEVKRGSTHIDILYEIAYVSVH